MRDGDGGQLRARPSRGLRPLPPAQLPTVPLGTWGMPVQDVLQGRRGPPTIHLPGPSHRWPDYLFCLLPSPPQQRATVVSHTKHPQALSDSDPHIVSCTAEGHWGVSPIPAGAPLKDALGARAGPTEKRAFLCLLLESSDTAR